MKTCLSKSDREVTDRVSSLIWSRGDPDFWRAFEDGEVKVIGDEPANTDFDPGSSEKSCIVRRRKKALRADDACGQ